MENLIINLSSKTKMVLRNIFFGFILWILSFWCVKACYIAPPESILEFFWGFSAFFLLVGIIAIIIGTIIFLSE